MSNKCLIKFNPSVVTNSPEYIVILCQIYDFCITMHILMPVVKRISSHLTGKYF